MQQLVVLTLIVAGRGWTTYSVLTRVVASWIHHLAAFRPLFALLDKVYADQRRAGQARRAIRLSQEAKDELLVCCALAPLAKSDLRTDFYPEVFATDATLHTTSITSASFWQKAMTFG